MTTPAFDHKTLARFWSKVDKNGPLWNGSACWLWTANKARNGYGSFSYMRTSLRAHRVTWELINGPIPDGLQMDHLCRNRACVNPQHLEPVTCKVNLLRGETFNARNAAKSHCIKGHPFTAENTYEYGWERHCIACKRERAIRANAKTVAKRFGTPESRAAYNEYQRLKYRERRAKRQTQLCLAPTQKTPD